VEDRKKSWRRLAVKLDLWAGEEKTNSQVATLRYQRHKKHSCYSNHGLTGSDTTQVNIFFSSFFEERAVSIFKATEFVVRALCVVLGRVLGGVENRTLFWG
jgi:hypothetical protein